MKISKIDALEVLDSRGNPTIMVEVFVGKSYGWAIVPSGASTGEFEAIELRDGDKTRFHGKGVLRAISNVKNIIAPHLVGKFNVTDQNAIDAAMIALDGTENKGKLGANAILGVSMACMYCAADVMGVSPYKYMAGAGKISLPVPMMNIINGGEHADNNLDVQEFMIIPHGHKTCADGIRMGAEVFHTLKKVLTERKLSTSVGDEGGFAPNLKSNREALELIMLAIKQSGYVAGKDFTLAMDVAASEFWCAKTKKYILEGKPLSSTQLIDYYEQLCREFSISSIEDGLDQNDWDGYVELTRRLEKSVQIVGDDFFCTNAKRLQRGIEMRACNAILIKLNQIGTVTETLQCIRMAQAAGFGVVISHRSGETEDTTISDLAVATNAGQIKTGSLSRTDRVAKYNRLIKIEKELLGG